MHDVTVLEDGKWVDKPWFVSCSCKGPEGRFATQFEAEAFGATHVSRRGGTVTVKSMAELEKEQTPVAEPLPVPPPTPAPTPTPTPTPAPAPEVKK